MQRTTRWAALVAALLLAVVALPGTAAAQDLPAADRASVDEAVGRLLALPYQPRSIPMSTDTAFGDTDYPAAFPLTDTAGGACCVSPVPDQPPLADIAPPFASFPEGFELIELESYDGTPLHAFVRMVPGAPGVVVAHGFNTNGKYSAVRFGAMLAANGYSVIVPDHRDVGREYERGGSYHPDGTRHGQTLGWKEAQDFLVAAEELRTRGSERVGMLGFSEGAQNTILALGQDLDGVIDAAMTFSAPADQATLGQRNDATTRALLTTVVNNPDVCDYLAGVGQGPEFNASANGILRRDSAVDTLDGIVGSGLDPAVPAVHFLAADDELVPSWNAVALASRTLELDTQRTVLVEEGNHAYFYDRWWTQSAILDWFATWLDDGAVTTADATVAQTPGGAPLAEQLVDLSGTTREEGDAELRTRTPCPESEAIEPTALLRVTGEDDMRRLDGRRSYSGWDDHEVVGYELDPGDGSEVLAGTDVLEALVEHRYEPGTYEVALTVTDDTGATSTTTREVVVEGAPAPDDPASPAPDDTASPAPDDTGAPSPAPSPAATASPVAAAPTSSGTGSLPATGGGAGLLALAAALTALATRRRPHP